MFRSAFASLRFPEVFTAAVRSYLRHALSCGDVEEPLPNPWLQIDHVTVYRLVQRLRARACGDGSDGDDDLPRWVAIGEVADRVGCVGEGEGAVDGRRDGAGLDEASKFLKVRCALLGG